MKAHSDDDTVRLGGNVVPGIGRNPFAGAFDSLRRRSPGIDIPNAVRQQAILHAIMHKVPYSIINGSGPSSWLLVSGAPLEAVATAYPAIELERTPAGSLLCPQCQMVLRDGVQRPGYGVIRDGIDRAAVDENGPMVCRCGWRKWW